MGTWQYPDELAGLLVHLARRNVRSALEVGHFKGWTSALLASYLRRFGLTRFLGFDTADWGAAGSGLEFRHGGRPPAGDWDFVLIDADHSYAAVRADWEYYRTRARLIAFHDVNDAAVRDTPGYDGGVWRLWREITQASSGRCFEFIRPDGFEAFGIGLVEL